MNIYLLRHGIAAERNPLRFPDDRLRPLTARGEEQVGKIAKAMHRLDLGIDTIWTSPLVRTRQTAAPVAKRLAVEEHVQAVEQLAPDGDPRALIEEIAGLDPAPAGLLLVGHEPYLSELLSILVSGRPATQVKLKKGSLAKLEVDGPIRFGQCATLQWLLPPVLLVRAG